MPEQADEPRDLSAGVPLAELDATPLIAGRVGEADVLLVRGASGLFAVGATCTHSGAPLAGGIVVGDTVRCPWHHACFHAPTGAALAAPALKALAAWTVEQRDGRAFVGRPRARADVPPRGGEERIVVVGAGAGGLAAADALAALGAGPRTTLLGDEREVAYDRTALSKAYLKGKLADAELGLTLDSLGARGVDVRLGVTVERIEPEAGRIVLAGGEALPYGKLILATGGEPRRLAVPGADRPHVHLLRTAADARAILAVLAGARHAVVVGGSFIGFEGAAALRDQGVAVTVVSPDPHPFRKTLGAALADAILAVQGARGTQLRLGAAVERIERDAVVLQGGDALPADLVLVGIGVEPRTGLARAAGLAVEDGVVVDERLRTSSRDVFAVGDIARWPDPHSGRPIRVEHWAVAQRQGQVAAMNALGFNRRYDAVPFFWTAQFDLSVRTVGHAGADAVAQVEGDLAARDGAVRFVEGGREVAVATVERDRVALEAELAMERRLGGPAAHLPPPE